MSVDDPAGDAARRIAPYGAWQSTLSAERIATGNLKLGQPVVAGDHVFWTEGRPQEQGRNALVGAGADGAARDLAPPPWNVRTRVHEYGGGAFAIGAGEIFFSNFADQRIYRLGASAEPVALTAAGAMRFADALVDGPRRRLIAVREDHSHAPAEAVNALVAVALDDGAQTVLAEGHDFYASACLSPDGAQLAWLTWDHPDMPWDGSELWVASICADGSLAEARKVAGSRQESIFQPAWSPSGELHFVSDRSGWWNLYRERAGRIDALCPMEAEFGAPQWVFGMTTYGFDGRGRIACTFIEGGISRLAVLEPDTGALRIVETPFSAIRDLKAGANFVAFVGGSAERPEALVRLELDSGRIDVIRPSGAAPHDGIDISRAEAITFPTAGGREAHAFYYAPRNRRFAAPAGERPPLLVIDHGGPTGATNATLRGSIQFWTERGFALVDVNYGGSTGFGRAYRERLDGQWGVVDVEDSIAAARFLVGRGDVDAARIAIRGASAGGYTTLAALTFHDFFAAGASHYGIGDLEALARDTHKFESRYLDRLVGPYPQMQALYRERSPIHHTERLSSALILFQGDEDRVVPPAQAEAMFAAVEAKGLPVACLIFAGEQHGFRRAENIRRALEAELYFYGRVLGFEPADRIDPVAIENLPPHASAPP